MLILCRQNSSVTINTWALQGEETGRIIPSSKSLQTLFLDKCSASKLLRCNFVAIGIKVFDRFENNDISGVFAVVHEQ